MRSPTKLGKIDTVVVIPCKGHNKAIIKSLRFLDYYQKHHGKVSIIVPAGFQANGEIKNALPINSKSRMAIIEEAAKIIRRRGFRHITVVSSRSCVARSCRDLEKIAPECVLDKVYPGKTDYKKPIEWKRLFHQQLTEFLKMRVWPWPLYRWLSAKMSSPVAQSW